MPPLPEYGNLANVYNYQ